MAKTKAPVFSAHDLKPEDFQVVRNAYKAEGRAVRFVYNLEDSWRRYEVNFTLPRPFWNFDVPGSAFKVPFLFVMDPYGDETLSRRIRQAVFGGPPSTRETLGIRYDTGEIVRIGFIDQRMPGYDRVLGLTFTGFPQGKLFLPDAYQKRIGELANKKRPFFLTLPDDILFKFIDRWASYRDLGQHLVVDLHFDKERLQVSGDSWRKVTRWENAPK